MSIVRENLMEIDGYSPYCGNMKCRIMPRTKFNGSQFHCKCCGWESKFDDAFINQYKDKWNK